MAVERGTPARSRFRTAVRRKSCGIRPGTPAERQAARHDFVKMLGRDVPEAHRQGRRGTRRLR